MSDCNLGYSSASRATVESTALFKEKPDEATAQKSISGPSTCGRPHYRSTSSSWSARGAAPSFHATSAGPTSVHGLKSGASPARRGGFALLGSAAAPDASRMQGVRTAIIDGEDLVVVAAPKGLLILPRAEAEDEARLRTLAEEL
jgi:hypothetical protein